MKSSFCIDLQRFMLIPTKFPLSHFHPLDNAHAERTEKMERDDEHPAPFHTCIRVVCILTYCLFPFYIQF